MSLDLNKVAAQVGGMVTSLKAGSKERWERLHYALNICHKPNDLEHLKQRIAAGKTTWLVAGLVDGLDCHYQPSPLPSEFTVLATDGSHIDVDRHRSTRCFLINIGSVILHYGTQPVATLDSFPHLYASDEDLIIAPASGGREQLLEGQLLGIKRGIEEIGGLAKIVSELPSAGVNLALLDGSLILWGLEAYPEFVTEALLVNGLLSHLDELKKHSTGRQLGLASYISFPRSTDVVNALRIILCPNETPDCDRYCTGMDKRDCDAVAGVQDRELFSDILALGERSAVFFSQSSVVRKHYGAHQVYFFYLKMDEEIARVEIPQWVAMDANLLGLVHTLVLDQCRRGQGYPVVLSEAHEQAVVTGADRENFWQLVESSLVEEHLSILGSAKSLSKRTRWV